MEEEIIASDQMLKYFQSLEDEVNRLYAVAMEARKKGLDPKLTPEIHLAKDVAGKVEGLMGLPGIGDRVRSLGEKMDRENVAFKIAQEVCTGKFGGNFSEEKLADKAIRAALAILTEGVTAAPLEGIAKVKIKRYEVNSRYLAIYFAGPIRSAGGTEAALTVLITDHVRRAMGLSEYKATRSEIKRFVEEIELYNRVMHLQSPSTAEQIEAAVENLPVEVTGESTNPDEVSAFRDLPRIETNSLRGGACLVLNDGIVGRAMKILKTVNAVGLVGWDWLKNLKGSSKKKDKKAAAKDKMQPSQGYIKDVIAGRPIFSHPSKPGGFRIRYGHARNTGLAGIGIHPSTMKVVLEFLAPGTHIRTERPGKGSVVMPVDSIEGPTVLLKDGSVIRLESYKQAEKYARDIKEILFLGDLLVGFGEFLENNHPLIPSGFVEEWWILYFESAIRKQCKNDFAVVAEKCGITVERLEEFLRNPITTKPTQQEALNFAWEMGVPLHPYYTYAWHDITTEELLHLRNDIRKNSLTDKQKVAAISKNAEAIVLNESFTQKRLLERLGIPHRVKNKQIIIDEHNLILSQCLQLKNGQLRTDDIDKKTPALAALNKYLSIEVRAKTPIYSGARMGRPEKAKERKMNPPVHALFPLEMEGRGNSRYIIEAGKKKEIEVTVVQKECPKCTIITHLQRCPKCGGETHDLKCCRICGRELESDFCEECKRPAVHYSTRLIDIAADIQRTKINLGGSIPPKAKGVKKLMNKTRVPELLEKGFLRARHDLNVYKDGTIRFDSTDIPLMHFKPREVMASIEQLHSFGYTTDIDGCPLTDEDQIVELKIQDVVLNIDNGEFLIRVSRYVDDMLELVYGMPRFYNFSRITDLIGHLVIGLAPHTSSGITGRIIGFTSVKGNLAHPYWHAAKRRNCFPGKEEILVVVDNLLTRLSLAELYNECFDGETSEKLVAKKDKPTKNIKVLSFDQETGQTVVTEIVDVIKASSPDHLIQFSLRTGRKFQTTPKHPVLVYSNDKIVEKRALEITKDDYFIVPKLQIDAVDIDSIDILSEVNKKPFVSNKQELLLKGVKDFVKDLVKILGLEATAKKIGVKKKTLSAYYTEYDSIPYSVLCKLLELHHKPLESVPPCSLGFESDSVVIPSIIKCNNALLKLTGHFIAEGSLRKNKKGYQVDFITREKEAKKEIKQLIYQVFGEGLHLNENIDQVTVSGRIVYLFFKEILSLGEKSQEKHIPDFLLNLPTEKLASLLSAYFSGCGRIAVDTNNITCSSCSYKLIQDVDTALLRFGIFGSITQHTKENGLEHEFRISGHDIFTYAKEINFTLQGKTAALAKVLPLLHPKEPLRLQQNNLVAIESIEHVPAEDEFVYSLHAAKYNTVIINENVVTHQCDGDEDAVILMLEGFLNFSKEFLPITRGGSMDAPLTLGIVLNPMEVDDESHAVDCIRRYPLEFYEQSFNFIEAKKIAGIIDLIANRLETTEQYENFHYTHPTTDIATGPPSTAYSRFGKMSEKLDAQLHVGKLVRAVDKADVAARVVNKHFFPDMIGCMRAFGSQTFRCIKCNTKFRRLPLSGRCTTCPNGGKLVLTVHKKTVTKYFDTAKELIEKYNLSTYIKQRLELFNESINEFFIEEEDNQTSLTEFFGF